MKIVFTSLWIVDKISNRTVRFKIKKRFWVMWQDSAK